MNDFRQQQQLKKRVFSGEMRLFLFNYLLPKIFQLFISLCVNVLFILCTKKMEIFISYIFNPIYKYIHRKSV